MWSVGLTVSAATALVGGAAWATASNPSPSLRSAPQLVGAAMARCFPAEGAAGGLAVVNLTPVGADTAGHGSLTSSAQGSGEISNVNYRPGTVDPNVAVATIGTDGDVCYHNSHHTALDLVADQLATIDSDSATANPHRLIDTRTGTAVAPSESRCFDADGNAGDLTVVNLTPVGATSAGHGALTSSDQGSAEISNVNYRPGTVDPNVAVTSIGTDGQVCYHNSHHTAVDLVADQLATISGERATADPHRLLDTRTEAARTIEMAHNSVFGFRLFAPIPVAHVVDRVGLALGEPDIDTGWDSMPPEWACTRRDEFRTLWWDDLRVTFERDHDGQAAVTAWSVGDPAAASLAPLGAERPPGASGVTTTEGLGVGSSRGDVLNAGENYMMVNAREDRISVITGPLVVSFVMDGDTVIGVGSGRTDCISGDDL